MQFSILPFLRIHLNSGCLQKFEHEVHHPLTVGLFRWLLAVAVGGTSGFVTIIQQNMQQTCTKALGEEKMR